MTYLSKIKVKVYCLAFRGVFPQFLGLHFEASSSAWYQIMGEEDKHARGATGNAWLKCSATRAVHTFEVEVGQLSVTIRFFLSLCFACSCMCTISSYLSRASMNLIGPLEFPQKTEATTPPSTSCLKGLNLGGYCLALPTPSTAVQRIGRGSAYGAAARGLRFRLPPPLRCEGVAAWGTFTWRVWERHGCSTVYQYGGTRNLAHCWNQKGRLDNSCFGGERTAWIVSCYLPNDMFWHRKCCISPIKEDATNAVSQVIECLVPERARLTLWSTVPPPGTQRRRDANLSLDFGELPLERSLQQTWLANREVPAEWWLAPPLNIYLSKATKIRKGAAEPDPMIPEAIKSKKGHTESDQRGVGILLWTFFFLHSTPRHPVIVSDDDWVLITSST